MVEPSTSVAASSTARTIGSSRSTSVGAIQASDGQNSQLMPAPGTSGRNRSRASSTSAASPSWVIPGVVRMSHQNSAWPGRTPNP